MKSIKNKVEIEATKEMYEIYGGKVGIYKDYGENAFVRDSQGA